MGLLNTLASLLAFGGLRGPKASLPSLPDFTNSSDYPVASSSARTRASSPQGYVKLKPINRRAYGANILRAMRVAVPSRRKPVDRRSALVVDRSTGLIRRRFAV